jgi:hypothetical protein
MHVRLQANRRSRGPSAGFHLAAQQMNRFGLAGGARGVQQKLWVTRQPAAAEVKRRCFVGRQLRYG